jgi:DNA-binding SARP family transcriptional activator
VLLWGLIGEVRIDADGQGLALGGIRQRALLARLLISRGKVVPRDQLVDDLYRDATSGAKALQVAVSRLRRTLAGVPAAAHRLQTTPTGYRLRVEPGELDADRFTALLAEGERAVAAGDAERGADRLQAALELWHGAVLGEFAAAPWAQAEAVRLDELRLRALHLRAEAELALGRHEGAIAELRRLVAAHPDRERLRATLMLALYRAGRQADALATYREGRRHLVEHHGIEPGRRLRELHQAILMQDPALLGPAPPDPPGRAGGQLDAPLILAGQLVIIRHDQGRLGELTDLIAQTLQANPRLTGYRSILALAYCEDGRTADAARVLAADAHDGFAHLAQDPTWLSAACTYAHVAARLLPLGVVPRETAETLRTMLGPWRDQVAYLGPAGGRLVAHHLAQLELALGDAAAAQALLETAVRRADALPAPAWAARARVELGRCLVAQGEDEAARDVLTAAVAAAAALGTDGIAREARELLGA